MLEQFYYDKANEIIATHGKVQKFLIPIMQDIQNALVYNNVYSKLEDDGETSKLFEYTVDSQKSYIETNTWNTPQIC